MRRASCMSLGTAGQRGCRCHPAKCNGKKAAENTAKPALLPHETNGCCPNARQFLLAFPARTDGDALGMDGTQVAVLQQVHLPGPGRLRNSSSVSTACSNMLLHCRPDSHTHLHSAGGASTHHPPTPSWRPHDEVLGGLLQRQHALHRPAEGLGRHVVGDLLGLAAARRGRQGTSGCGGHPTGAMQLRLHSTKIGTPRAACRPRSWSSLTSRAKGSLRISRLVLRWYLRISRSATVPGRKRCGFSVRRQGQGVATQGDSTYVVGSNARRLRRQQLAASGPAAAASAALRTH